MERVLWILFFAGSFFGFSQDIGNGTPYAYYGLGEDNDFGNNDIQLMQSIRAYSDSLSFNIQNPSTLGGLKLVNYSTSSTLNSYEIKNQELSENITLLTIDYIGLAFPIHKKTGVSFGVAPYFDTTYIINENEEDDKKRNQYTADGGVYRFFLMMGYQITKDLSFGIRANYNFGKVTFQNTKGVVGVDLSTRQNKISIFNGADFQFAFSYQKELNTNLRLYSTVIYTPESELVSENKEQLYTLGVNSSGITINDFKNLNLEDKGLAKTKVNIPSKYVFSIGFGNPSKWFLGFDIEQINMSEFSRPFQDSPSVVYTDRLRTSIGGWYTPNVLSLNYFKRIKYLAGARIDDKGFELSNRKINIFVSSFGVVLPLLRFSHISAGVEYGIIGTDEDNLLKENRLGVKLGITFKDLWFIKRKYN